MIGTIVNCISIEVFQKMDNVCFGIVVAKGINNEENKKITELLKNNIELTEAKFQDRKVKELEEIVYYRDSFVKLGMNPNKFKSSIEAIITRIVKKKGFPSINPIVDLGNAASIKYLVPSRIVSVSIVSGLVAGIMLKLI